SVSIIGGRLAVGARGDDGANEFESQNGYMLGTVYLFNLVDSSGNVTSDPSAFSEIRMQGRIGDYNGAEYKSITAFADGGTGVTTITSRSHRRTAGDSITIAETTNYDGTFTISSIVDDNTFTISTAFVANDATGNMQIDNVFPNDINLGSTYDTTGTGPAANRTGESEVLGGIQNSDRDRNDGDAGFVVSLSEGADGSTRLALGMPQNDGAGESGDQQDEGAVLLFTFDDATNKDFSSGQLAAVIGEDFNNNYSGANPRSGKDLDISLDGDDYFGYSVGLDYDPVLNRHRLAVLAPRDDGVAGSNTNHGRVYLFTFTDDSFSGAAHTASVCADCAAQIGGKHLTKLLVDSAGADPNFNKVALDGNYLAISSLNADGNGGDDTGDVYIYSFSHLSGDEFANGTLEGSVGYNFTGGTTEGTRDIAVVPESGEELRANDFFGSGIALYNNRLVAGAYEADGSGDSHGGAGDIHIFDISHYEVADGSDFDNSTTTSQINNATSSDDITIWPSSIENILSGGSNVTLQANNDITVNAAITAANGSGDGGDLTMQAGRTIDINANITTDNGDLTLTANETLANGVVDAQRDSGNAEINLTGATINTGTGTFTATISAGADKTNSGTADITLNTVTAGALVMTNNGTTAGSDILDSGVLTVSGTSSFTTAASGGVITLDSANALTGAVSLNTSGSSGHATLDNGTTALNIGTSTIEGNLTLTAGDDITDSGVLTVGGTSSFTADVNDKLITLDQNHALTGAISITTTDNESTVNNDADVTISGMNSGLELKLGTLTIKGDLSITTASTVGISDEGVLTIHGTSDFVTSTDDATINLGSTNFFNGEIDLSTQGTSGHVTLVQGDSTMLKFAASEVGGNLNATTGSGSAVQQTGILTVDGTTFISTKDAGSDGTHDSNVKINSYENVLTGAVSLEGWNVRLINSKAVEVGTLKSRALILTARGAITQSLASVITSEGSSTITAQSSDTNT
ncbi:MAG: hypothetical protein HOM55_02065, partial [Proteobacteria bacterium]|nr:hypothetical protein [Pseudomonadota bacterium]